jgi:hypothetical protein
MRDGTRSEADWDTQSISSTQILDGKSTIGGRPSSFEIDSYLDRGPVATRPSSPQLDYVQPHESTDYLLHRPAGDADIGDDWRYPQRMVNTGYANHRQRPSDEPIALTPLLDRDDSAWEQPSEHLMDAAYPPSSRPSPPPGYATPPRLARMITDDSQTSVQGRPPMSNRQPSWDSRERF